MSQNLQKLAFLVNMSIYEQKDIFLNNILNISKGYGNDFQVPVCFSLILWLDSILKYIVGTWLAFKIFSCGSD